MKSPYSSKVQAFPLQLVLIVPFVLQIFAAVGLVGYLSFKNGQKAVNDLADQLMDRTSTMVDQHLTSYLSIPHKVSQMNADVIEMGLLDVRARKTVGKYFWHQMQAYDLSYIGIGLTTGEGVGAARYDGKTVTMDDWSAKPPKNWYSYALDQQGNHTRVLEVLDWNNFEQPNSRWAGGQLLQDYFHNLYSQLPSLRNNIYLTNRTRRAAASLRVDAKSANEEEGRN